MNSASAPALRRSIPGMMRLVRSMYGSAVRADLAAAGFDDLPENGPAALTAILRDPRAAAAVAGELAISKQVASQLIDRLVLCGYVDRAEDPEDRRRMRLMPTPRGREAVAVVRQAATRTDALLEHLVGAEAIATLRATLAAILAAETNDA